MKNLSKKEVPSSIYLWVHYLRMELRKQEFNSVHRQSLKKLAPHLKVTARSSEDEVIEGVESFTDAPFIGVQWHPEFLLGHKQLADQGLFYYFVKSFK